MNFKKKDYIITLFIGIISTVLLGLVKNGPKIGIPEIKYYGYPLSWRATITFQPQRFIILNFLIDFLFWVAIFGIVIFLLNKFDVSIYNLLMLVALIIFCGFFMDIVHELGHVLWGSIAGGELHFFKIGFLEFYPKIELTNNFELGKALLSGFETDFGRGIYLLGGSLTTNLVSWIFTVFRNKNILYRISGVFGLLDLPLYVFLPQLGVRHWVLRGGLTPEPLLGAKKVGVPDELFYLLVLSSTIALIYLYFFRKKPISLLFN
ncbi:hypothetical protein C9439_02975 [archaeon SCG-AAA382B04]|nr:hypothetical protein C9439_02975 [archaeon SCG-AAA382B04]